MSAINARIKLKKDTSSNWETKNPILLDGELIIVSTDNGVKFKVGDGETPYKNLAFSDEILESELLEVISNHASNEENPHGVTKAQVGLDKVPNVDTNDQTPTYTQATTLATLISGEKLNVSMGKIMKAITDFISHKENTSNPHGVTKAQVGLGNVENKSSATIRGEITKANVTTALGTGTGTTKYLREDGSWATPPDTNTTYGVVSTTADGLAPKRDGSTTKFLRGDGTWAVPPDTNTTYTIGTGDSDGQIKVTPSSGSAYNVYVKGFGDKLNASLKGIANGLAELDSNGKVPSSQLPSYVDDVVEGYYYNSKFYKESTHTTVITGETGKIYIDLTSNKTYRWGGSAFAEISASLALGETSSTAYRGDRGKIAYDHAVSDHDYSAIGHKHTVSHTPAGSVSKPTFSGTKATISTKHTPAGSVSKPTFSGTEVTSGSASDTTTVYSITDVGVLPSCTYTAPSHTYTAPSLTASVTNRCLKLTFNAGSHSFNAGSHSFDAGKLPTKGNGVSVSTGGHTHKVTASGTVSQPTFTGTEATISAEYTPAGSVSQPTFTGTAATLTTSADN